MTDGDIQRLDSLTCTQYGANDLFVMPQRHPGAFSIRHFAVFTDQACFGNADARQVLEYTEMAGDAKTSGVGVALAVAEQQVWPAFEFAKSLPYGRNFPERQQTRHVWKSRGSSNDCMFHQSQISEV